MRILVTVRPRMYRETLALALHRHRPDAEVIVAPADALDGQVTDLVPDLLVRNADDGLSPEYLDTIACRIEVLYTDSMDVRINLDGQVREMADMSVEDLLAVVGEAEGLISGKQAD